MVNRSNAIVGAGYVLLTLLLLGWSARPLSGEAPVDPEGAEASVRLQEGAVTGRVVDASTGDPLEGVQVSIVDLGMGALTDESGRYRIVDVPAGEYTLRFRTFGFASVERRIRVRAGASTRVDARLQPEAIRLREITVAPRRRLEIAREVPITETVFDAEDIRDAEITRPKEMLQMTPGATLVRSVDSGCCAFISLRGIGQQRNTETPVAVVVDGVQQFSPLQFDQPLYDIERLEVIKGPEGAIYGRNAIAGAILVETKEPTNEYEGFLRAGGGKGGKFTLTGAYGGPIVEDELLFRVAGHFRDQNGYFTNPTLGQKVDFLHALNMRAKLRWNVSPSFQVDVKATADQTESNSLGLFTYQPAVLGPDGRTLADTPFPFDFSKINSNSVDRTPTANNLGVDERNIEQVSVSLNWDLGDAANLESISSYNSVENERIGDNFPYTASTSRTITGFGPVDGTQTQWKDVEGWSSELRIRSPEDQAFRWQIGSYLLTWNRFISASVGVDQGQGIERLKQEPAFDSSTNPTLSWLADDNDNEAWAVFGNLEYDLVEDLTVSGAIRYDRESREQFVSEDNTAGAPGATNTATFDKPQPKFRLAYAPEIQSDVLNFVNLYGSWGIGFRSGQFNQNGVAEAAADAGIEGVRDVINQEEASTAEAGFKSRWFNDRLAWNTSFFKTDDEGQPFFLFIGQVGAQVLVNIPEADIQGFESTLRAIVAPGLDFYAAGGITDTEIESFPVDPTAVGGMIPLVPHSTFNIGAQYRGTLFGDFGVLARADYERLGEMAWTAVNSTPRNPVNQLSLKGGIEFDGWTAKVVYDNVTDEVYNSEFVKGGFAWPAPPDRWLVTVETTFGPGAE